MDVPLTANTREGRRWRWVSFRHAPAAREASLAVPLQLRRAVLGHQKKKGRGPPLVAEITLQRRPAVAVDDLRCTREQAKQPRARMQAVSAAVSGTYMRRLHPALTCLLCLASALLLRPLHKMHPLAWSSMAVVHERHFGALQPGRIVAERGGLA